MLQRKCYNAGLKIYNEQQQEEDDKGYPIKQSLSTPHYSLSSNPVTVQKTCSTGYSPKVPWTVQ